MEWQQVRLGDVVDCNPSVKLEKGISYPLIDIDKITVGYKFATNRDEVCFTGQSGSRFENGDTLMARITPCLENGKIAQAKISGKGIGSTELFIFRGKQGVTDNDFVYYLFKQQWIRDLAANSMSGASGRQRADLKFIKKITFSLPPLPTQRRIASILSTYDSLIENNTRRIRLLEQMAENLYKEWFVRFRFPGHETCKMLDGIPEGWKYGRISDVCTLFDGKRIPLSSMVRESMAKIYPYYGAAELMDYVDNYIFDGVYLLMGEDGSVITPDGFPILQLVRGKFWVNNHAHIMQGKNGFSTEMLYLFFKKMNITGIVTGSAQPKISQGRLLPKHIIIPTMGVLKTFDEIIQPIFSQISSLQSQNASLARQRDLLLPRLMSGKKEV